jgi:3-isopropylmalate/(R)-2-methylmalate dehydratase large subunit
MGMALSHKILAKASGRREVSAGEVVWAMPDLIMMHDLSGYGAAKIFLEEFGEKARIWDPDRVVVVEDHFVPSNTVDVALNKQFLERFVSLQKIRHYYPFGVGEYGICHVLLPQEGFVKPGMFIIGGDSHTTTYGALGAFATGMGHTDIACALYSDKIPVRVPGVLRIDVEGMLPSFVTAKDLILKIIGDIGTDGANNMAMEFSGPAISRMGMDERMVLANMAVEAGADTGIVEPDDVTMEYLSGRVKEPLSMMRGDPDAKFDKVYTCNASGLVPLVAKPYSPANVSPAAELSNIEVDQVFIGSCTGGRLEDLRMAAKIIKGRRLKARTIVTPATRTVYIEALQEGLIDIFVRAGAVVTNPTCGPCGGGHLGLLGQDEVCVSTSNRNFVGRMGHRTGRIYLASPFTAAASAVTGRITDPRGVV